MSYSSPPSAEMMCAQTQRRCVTTLSSPEGVFKRVELEGQPGPVVIDVSRSGRRYPVEFRPDAPFKAVHGKISMYVDDLLALAPQVGATLLCAEFPITVVDPNRACDDVDPALYEGELPFKVNPSDQSLKNGAGLIHGQAAGKVPLYNSKLAASQVLNRIRRYYDPYHAELERLLGAAKETHGQVFHLSFHCMSSIDPKNPQSPEAARPDICLGDRDGTACDIGFREFVAERFRECGYGVTINTPFKGSELMRRYGAPKAGRQSLQIEICKRLFMEEASGELSERFNHVQQELREIVRAVCGYAAKQLSKNTVGA